ncbi:MAG: hypothetical protein A2Y40_00395 [Candidatus Margulisbacteria bacterium GWF2_35_9]|nr:MAG: hypothetical protein A2Y40_00395 [Candidatus Margulisbacteria bacterium GWF2_35_9]
MYKSRRYYSIFFIILITFIFSYVFSVEHDLKIIGGVGAPYGFGGVNISYAINNRYELSFGLGLADNLVSGIPLFPMVFGFKYFPPAAYWNPNIIQYASMYYGTVGILTETYYLNLKPPTYSSLTGVVLGFGYYLLFDTDIINFIPFIPKKILVDVGLNYLIPLQTLPSNIESTFQIVNYYIAAGLVFNFEIIIPKLPNLLFFLED